MAIDFNTVKFSLLKAGDTLRVTGKPHYHPKGHLAVKRGEEVMVTEVHAEGVTVKTKSKDTIQFFFEHGAEKLQYTDATKKAITDREAFGNAPEKNSDGSKEKSEE